MKPHREGVAGKARRTGALRALSRVVTGIQRASPHVVDTRDASTDGTVADEPHIVIVGMDYSGVSHFAFSEALRLGQRRPNVQLHVIHVDPQIRPDPRPRSSEEERGLAFERLERLIRGELEISRRDRCTSAERAEIAVRPHIRTGRAGREIAQLAVDLCADLVVVGSHGRTGISPLLLGSVAHAVMTLAPCPVLVVRPKDINVWNSELEQPCRACRAARRASAGVELWCDAHHEYHGQRFTRAHAGAMNAEPVSEPRGG